MRLFVCFLVVLIAACGGGDDGEAAARTKCESLRNHLVDLRLAGTTNVDVASHRAAMLAALGDTFITDCETKLNAAEVDCALAAADTTTAVGCKPPPE